LKKNYFLRSAAVLLVFGLFSLSTVPRTLSRYSYTTSGSSSTVRAGIFEVAIKRADGSWVSICHGTTGTPFIVDMYEALLQAATGTAHNDNVIHNPSPAGSAVLIAPGTAAVLKVTVKNYSEVSAKVTISAGDPIVTPAGYEVPIEWFDYSIQTSIFPPRFGEWVDFFPGIPNGVAGGNDSATLSPLGGEQEFEFLWKWEYERGGTAWGNAKDGEDTVLGIPGNITYKVPMVIEVAQID